MQKIAKILILVLSAIYLGLILNANRALFFSKFDVPYWKDKYEHSQWKLPLSPRTIGDDGLYYYEGYRLIHGEDPTVLNAEVPPFGKYLIGLSIITLGNGYWFGFITSLAAVIILYFLTETLIKNQVLSLLVAFAFLVDPLITQQFPLTMLDSNQVLFSLLSLLALTKLLQQPKNKFRWSLLILLSLAFGLFAGTKAPLFSPFLGLVMVVSLYIKFRDIKKIIAFILLSGVAYLLPYVPYFFLGHTFRNFLSVQKWIVAFYRSSNLHANFGSIFTTLLTNQYQNIFSTLWETSSIWSLAWPVITVTGFLSIIAIVIHYKRPQNNIFLPIIGFLLLSVLFLAIIPFWTRYLIMIIPLLYLLTAYFFKKIHFKISLIIFIFLSIFNLYFSYQILYPTPESTVKEFTYEWSEGFFQDMYQETTNANRKSIDISTFHKFGLSVYHDAQIESVVVKIINPKWSKSESPQKINLHITYITRNLGFFAEDKAITVVKEDGQWRIVWDWNNLIDKLSLNSKLETNVDFGKRGTVYAVDGKTLIADEPGYMIWVTPQNTDKSREEELLHTIDLALGQKIPVVAIHQRIFGNNISTLSVPLGVTPENLDYKLMKKLSGLPGVTLTPQYFRAYHPNNIVDPGHVENNHFVECCSYLYTSNNYIGVSGLEKTYDETLKGTNGGTLIIKDATGKIIRSLIEVKRADGRNIYLGNLQ